MAHALPYFLGVERSFAGRPWRARLDAAGEARALAIAQAGGCDELLARVLAGRGVGLDEVARHLDPTLRALMPDPFALADMEEATARLAGAVRRAERVAIFADYDVDGAASAALLSEYLQACGCETIVHIPDRVTEGYGPNREAMAAFAARASSSPSIAARSATSRSPKRAGSASTSSSSTITRRRSACLTRSRSSIPTARTTSPGLGISAPRASSTWASSR
jgi:single-stranded-DNA-specific exonuclease